LELETDFGDCEFIVNTRNLNCFFLGSNARASKPNAQFKKAARILVEAETNQLTRNLRINNLKIPTSKI
jgi:hypothetical protein